MTGKKISITWIEAILLIAVALVGVASGTIATSFIDSERAISQPREETFIRNAQLPRRQSELATAQAELTTLQTNILAQQLELAKQTAKLESMKAIYPALNKTENLDATESPQKPEVTAFKQAQVDLDSTRRVLQNLNARLPEVTTTATQKAIDVNIAQESVHEDFERAQKRFHLWTRVLAFGAGLMLSLAILDITAIIALYLNFREPFDIRLGVILLCGFAMLLALTAYQSFQVAGATFMIIVILLVAAILGLRRVKEEGAS